MRIEINLIYFALLVHPEKYRKELKDKGRDAVPYPLLFIFPVGLYADYKN
jgi:hypothetical protein